MARRRSGPAGSDFILSVAWRTGGCTAYRSDMLTGTALLGQYDKRMNVIIGG